MSGKRSRTRPPGRYEAGKRQLQDALGVEEAPPPGSLTRFLRTLAVTGELQQLAGLVLGRPGGDQLPVDEHVGYDQAVLQVVREEQRLDTLPVVTGVDLGHTDPIWTIPQDTRVRIDPDHRTITLLETADD